jgi:hypothetical protein
MVPAAHNTFIMLVNIVLDLILGCTMLFILSGLHMSLSKCTLEPMPSLNLVSFSDQLWVQVYLMVLELEEEWQ